MTFICLFMSNCYSICLLLVIFIDISLCYSSKVLICDFQYLMTYHGVNAVFVCEWCVNCDIFRHIFTKGVFVVNFWHVTLGIFRHIVVLLEWCSSHNDISTVDQALQAAIQELQMIWASKQFDLSHCSQKMPITDAEVGQGVALKKFEIFIYIQFKGLLYFNIWMMFRKP